MLAHRKKSFGITAWVGDLLFVLSENNEKAYMNHGSETGACSTFVSDGKVTTA